LNTLLKKQPLKNSGCFLFLEKVILTVAWAASIYLALVYGKTLSRLSNHGGQLPLWFANACL